MIDKSLRVLEFNKITTRLEAMAESEAGKAAVRELRPLTNLRAIEKLQDGTSEAKKLIDELGKPPLFGIYDLSESLVYASKGGVLTTSSLLRISSSLRVAMELKDYLFDEDLEADCPLIEDMVKRLDPIKNLQKEIDRIILDEGEIANNASAKLSSIRSSLDRKNDQVREKINSIVRSNSSYLQDNIATIRDGRHVVPVKSQYRNSFKGIVHDQSASGQTVYIEPISVIELNNEIKILLEEEREEIQRILRKLSERVGLRQIQIQANQNIMVELDSIFARGKLAIAMEATRPELNKSGRIRLVEARHPLLEGRVVPISLELGYDFTSLLITGPNTGGKTVALKTVGLLTLMAQAGLQVPCQSGSELAVFSNVFADIGDEQSIEQSLSTFSSHMVNIVSILENVDENSLVLFDELGAGTDPTEGSALAISILDSLLKRNIRTIATTHYAELKLYALNTEGVENASVEFDIKSLRPTYRLQVGTVGKSNAFEISKRLGLKDDIIENASKLLSSDKRSFEDALVNIEEDRKTIERLKLEIKRKEEDSEKIQARLEKELANAEKSKDRIVDEAKEKASQIIEEAREKARESIRELNEIRRSSDNVDMKRAHEIKRDLDESQKDHDTKSYDFLNVKSDEKPKNLKLGEEVEVISMGQTGQVVQLPDSNGDLVVEMGILKVNTNLDQIRRAKTKEREESKTSVQNIIKSRMSKQIDNEIDLRGKNIEEARQELDIYLDDAYLSGLKEVRIIHGKGTGVLRKGVEEYLRGHRLVEEYRMGDINEGGSGVTVAKIKK